MKHLTFYFRYAFRNIQRGGRWTALAILCIAAGVATVVALRSLGLAISDSLVENVRVDNKGDVRLVKDNDNGPNFALFTPAEDQIFFSEEELQALEAYVQERGGLMTAYSTGGSVQLTDISQGAFGIALPITTYLIDPATYPPNYDINTIDPPGQPLDEVFTGGPEIVISENLAESEDLEIGDPVRISRTEQAFTVVGIVALENEASIRNPFNGFFGFAYMPLAAAREFIDPALGVNNVAIAFDEPLTEENYNAVLRDLRQRATRTTRTVETDTALDLLERNAVISQILGDFIVVLGLGALLIGGVGIMNTMLVLVRRRTNEIAALKTFGLKGGQVGWLFLAEGLLLGIIGSVIGAVVGVLLGGVVNQFGEQFLQQSLTWRVYPEALLYGFALGMVTTIIFGLAPILTALQIRPAIILRPNDSNKAPRLGIFQSIGLMLVVTLLIGLVVGQIVSPSFGLVSSFNATTPYLAGIIGVAATLLFLGLLVLILWVIVWLVGKLPSFGNVDLRLALRNLSTNRLRTATTLLALSAGMFALSSITFVGEGVRELLNIQLSRSFGGNVLVFSPASFTPGLQNLTGNAIEGALEDVEGVNGFTVLGTYEATLIGVDDRAIQGGSFRDVDFDEVNFGDQAAFAPFIWSTFTVWDSTNPDIYDTVLNISKGRNLTPEDEGRLVMVGPEDTAAFLGAGVGSILRYEINGEILEYELVGLFQSDFAGFSNGGPVVPPGSVGGLSSRFNLYSADVEPEFTGQAVAELSAIRVPPVFALDIRFIDTLISRLIEQFAALPTIVGLLSLLAAAVIMANTVALATLERRRQIGILKSVGLKSWRVLGVMLIESTIIGLLSAVLGIGLSWFGISLFAELSGTFIPLPRSSQIVALALTVASVLIAWGSTFLSANVAVRERVMNVLRYE